MTRPSGSGDIEARLTAALTDTAHRNLSEAASPPLFRPDSSANQLDGRTGSVVVAMLAAAIVIAVIAALLMPDRAPHSAQPADRGPGAYIVLRARTDGLSKADLDKARQIISARAASLGAANADVRIAGPDEISAFLPNVKAGSVGDLGVAGVLEIRPVLNYPAQPQLATQLPDGNPLVVDPWKTLGFAAPKDDVAYHALGQEQHRAVQSRVDNWDCDYVSRDRSDASVVACSQDGTVRYLLGPTIVASGEIELASQADAQGHRWTIAQNLDQAGFNRLSEYAAWHGGWQYNGKLQGDLAYGYTDFALTLDGVVIAEFLITKPLTDSTIYAVSPEHFDKVSTMRLTGYLDAGQLPTAFDVVSIKGG
jgi:preprotein translocase subunit SecD